MRKIIIILVLAITIGLFPRPKDEKLDAMPTIRFARMGTASWYSRKSPGINKRTANNEIFDDQALNCAMWGVEFNRMVKVTNLENGKSVVVRVNDRGPHERFVRKGRIIDLTQKAFSHLGNTKNGLMTVEIEFL